MGKEGRSLLFLSRIETWVWLYIPGQYTVEREQLKERDGIKEG